MPSSPETLSEMGVITPQKKKKNIKQEEENCVKIDIKVRQQPKTTNNVLYLCYALPSSPA